MSLGRHTTYNLVGNILPVIGALITVPIYVKIIGPARYGVLAIAWILLGYFGLFDLGLGRATSFRIAARRDASPGERADTFWAAVIVNILMGIVGGAILWLVAGLFFAKAFKVSADLRPEIMAAVPLLALSVPVATLSGVLTGALQGREKFLSLNIVSVASSLLFQLLPLSVAWIWGPNIVRILGAALLARLTGMIVIAGLCHLELVRGQPIRLDRREIPNLLKYGGWVTVAALLGPLLTVVDRFAIGATVGAVAVAVYTIPYQPAKQIQMLPAALTTALFPRISAASEAARSKYASSATFTLLSLVTLPVLGAIFIAQPALILWVGHALGERCTPVGRTLLIGFWVNALAMIAYTNLQASGRPDLVTKVQVLEIPFYFLALWGGLTYFGIVGAALAFLFRCSMDYLFLNWVNNRRFPGLAATGANLLLLVVGAYLSSLWVITDVRWWVSAIGLGLVTLAIAWWTLPKDIKEQLLRQIVSLGEGAAIR